MYLPAPARRANEDDQQAHTAQAGGPGRSIPQGVPKWVSTSTPHDFRNPVGNSPPMNTNT
jgi:hypothetical protein